jgi:hypothetical protein
MFGALFLLSALLPPHPLLAFGPPGPTTPEVKPDWYLMWIYGFLKIVPTQATFSLFGATIGPNFIGGLLFPALLFGLLTFAPWIDRTNRRVVRRIEYLEPIRQTPVRLASGVAVLAFLGTLFVAAYYDTLGLSLAAIWAIVIGVPLLAGIATWVVASRSEPGVTFDPRESPVPVALAPSPMRPREPAPVPAPTPGAPVESATTATTSTDRGDSRSSPPALPTRAARGDRARDSLVAALHEAGELAPLVRQLDDDEDLLDVLAYVDSLRLSLAESNQVLQGVVRGAVADEPVPDVNASTEPDRG